MEFKDYFSKHSKEYGEFRPSYPESIFSFLVSISPQREVAWDCATGTGQAAVPAFFKNVGARTAASLCLTLVVVGKMFIGSTDGMGKVIMDRRYSDDVPTLYSAIIVTGFIGYGINYLFPKSCK